MRASGNYLLIAFVIQWKEAWTAAGNDCEGGNLKSEEDACVVMSE